MFGGDDDYDDDDDDDENIFGDDDDDIDVDIFEGVSPSQCGKRNRKKKTNLNVGLTKVVS